MEESKPTLKTGASLARGRSKQIVGTPREFLDACERRFGPIAFDLAATRENAVHGLESFYGPGSRFGEDSLIQDWSQLTGTLWLNPPFDNIAPWAKKLASICNRSDWALMLVPASIGTNWYSENLLGNCCIDGLAPRLTFVGSHDPYPKDLMLIMSGFGIAGHGFWRWDK